MQSLLNLFDLYGERFLVVGVSLLSLTFVTLMFVVCLSVYINISESVCIYGCVSLLACYYRSKHVTLL